MLGQALGGLPLAFAPTYVPVGASTTLSGFAVVSTFGSVLAVVGIYTPTPTALPITGPPFFAAEISISKTGTVAVDLQQSTLFSVSSLTQTGGTATATTSAAHGYAAGERIWISGASQAAYNGQFTLLTASGTTFTYTVTGSPTSPATAQTGQAIASGHSPNQGVEAVPIEAINQTTGGPLNAVSAILVSDIGYRTAPTDTGIAGLWNGVNCYWPAMSSAFQINRACNLDPSASGVAASWGTLSLLNYANQWDVMASQWNSDNRPVKIYYGNRTFENFPEWRGTRASVGTYIDINGKMQNAGVNEVRWDFSTGSAAVLSEATATNFIANDTTAVSKNGADTVSISSDVPALRESSTVSKSTYATTGGDTAFAYRGTTITFAVGATYTGSVYVWVPFDVNPTSRFYLQYELASVTTTQAFIDMTKTGQWVRYSVQFSTASTGISGGFLVLRNIPLASTTNKLINSSLTSSWTSTGSPTITTNTAGAPDGTATLNHWSRITTAASWTLQSQTKAASSLPYAFSIYAQAGTYGRYLSLAIQGTFPNATSVAFDLLTGRAGTVNNTGSGFSGTATITPVGGGLYRCSVTTPTSDATTQVQVFYSFNSANNSRVDAVDSVANSDGYVWGAQLEQSTVVSAYIPTTTVAVTQINAVPDVVYTTCWQAELGSVPTSYIHTFGSAQTRATDFNFPSRQIWLDPAYASLKLAFAGVSQPWVLSDTALSVPIRDATYWLEKPVNSSQYSGSNGVEGPTAMRGIPKPMLRGICYNVTPTLIDANNRLYQYNNGPGTIQALYEGGATGAGAIQIDTTAGGGTGDVSDLLSGTTAAGHYRTCNALGMFQLGSNPQRQITVDATGAFLAAGVQTSVANIARYLMTEDMQIPAANINVASFSAAATAYPYPAGIYIDSSQNMNGIDVLNTLMESLAAKLTISRTGQVSMFVLRTIPANTTPVATFNPSNIVSLVPKPLPTALAPPPYRWRIGYAVNWTVQNSDLNTGIITTAHKQYIATQRQYAAAYSQPVLSSFARAIEHTPIGGALNAEANALTVANDMVALWSTTRSLYTVTVPVSVGITRDIGDVVTLVYPAIVTLAGGALGQIVSEVFNSLDSTISYDLLI